MFWRKASRTESGTQRMFGKARSMPPAFRPGRNTGSLSLLAGGPGQEFERRSRVTGQDNCPPTWSGQRGIEIFEFEVEPLGPTALAFLHGRLYCPGPRVAGSSPGDFVRRSPHLLFSYTATDLGGTVCCQTQCLHFGF